jgi:hypothetical protein
VERELKAIALLLSPEMRQEPADIGEHEAANLRLASGSGGSIFGEGIFQDPNAWQAKESAARDLF